jgi:formamidopyrimidine-DNA glycosylase
MPELPEVETVRRGLTNALVGKTLTDFIVHEPRLRWPIPTAQLSSLIGKTLHTIDRRSKYLLFRFGNASLLSHLGMTGSFGVHVNTPPPRRTHDHVELCFNKTCWVRYHDPRRFGSMHWLPNDDHPLLDALGPEPLTDAFDAKFLHEALRHRRTPIKAAIMDSHVVVGVGNIYASESLFRAGIHPNRAACRVSLARCEKLVDAIKQTLQEAIAAGGSTLRDFVNSEGEPGYFQQHYFAYAREAAPCRRCGTAIKRMVHGNRATYYCPSCQR